ncbi:uncharacterized protein LOC125229818 [Leguminivora glycinivorella]|uniref:uncharacterized protein LOC125229818 n=1 Tax=Leguminivora glycinivorella TaxID=1035111 RepID=UPI0020102D81|nr:uncharacterized protein LOC125229818 [Leguminivora glycinivorella]
MLSPEDQQVQICLLKSNLEEIESSLVVQRSALPELDEENERQYRETMTALKVSRAQNEQIERLKQENVRLTAKRTQLKHQCEGLAEALQAARDTRARVTGLIKDEERAEESYIRTYEDSLQNKAERFRQTRSFYDETQMTRDFEEVNKTISEFESEVARRQQIVGELKNKLGTMTPGIPEDLPVIMGKMELAEKLKLLMKNTEDLRLKVNNLKKQDNKL